MPDKKPKKDAAKELEVGDCVVVTGPVAHSGEYAIIVGFFRREQGTNYALVFENGWANLPRKNLLLSGTEFCAALKASSCDLK